MRITGGTLKGQMIHLAHKSPIRPTCSRVKEAVFNMLQEEIEGAYFLDIFAGSGSMGIEALSRGAAFATFIEKDKYAAANIRKHLTHFNLSEKTLVLCLDAYKSLFQEPFAKLETVLYEVPAPENTLISPNSTAQTIDEGISRHNLVPPQLKSVYSFAKGSQLKNIPQPFSIVYIDPPYDDTTNLPTLLKTLLHVAPLATDTHIFIELRAKTPLDFSSIPIYHIKTRVYADNALWHFSNNLDF